MVIIPVIFALRVFGFMAVLPVISVAAINYNHYSISLIGWAIGIYGLMQACFHIPMGFLSDKYGRRTIVIFGLSLMLIGSVIAALTDSLYGLIFARALQGSGAVGSVLNAWCADITSEASRTRAMALIGITIGITFLLAIILGPLIVDKIGLSGLFWLTAVLALFAMMLTIFLPEINKRKSVLFHSHISKVVKDSSLRKLNFGIFTVHASYTSLFLIIPNLIGSINGAWKIYLVLMLPGIIISLLAMFLAEAKGHLRKVLLLASLLFLGSHLIFLLHGQYVALFCYFSAFTMLEAILPSLLSKYAPDGHKGTAMGVFACAQYFGIFLGSVIGGWLLHNLNNQILVFFGIILSIIWLFMAFRLPVIAISK